jgi:probable DNA repair protein
MGTLAGAEIDAGLRGGGLVITASDRAARALADDFHRARQAEGLKAWPVPRILDWKRFARDGWEQRAVDARTLLNPTQEEALWVEIAAQDSSFATLLEGPRHRLAALAMEAHGLLCSYAPRFLETRARSAWQQDAGVFSGWLEAFDERCRSANLLSASRLPHEFMALIDGNRGVDRGVDRGADGTAEWDADRAGRPQLLLAGFDRILPAQRSLFDAWGEWHEVALGEPAAAVHFHEAEDAQAELAACAIWCGRQLAARPEARLLVIAQAARAKRGEIERAFLRHTGETAAPVFEFSLGIPLSQVAPARAALLLLRWLDGSLAEQELDWLLSTGLAGASVQESAALEACMRALRQRGLERQKWTLAAFLGERCSSKLLPPPWVARLREAQHVLAEFARRPQSPLDWAGLVSRLLDGLHFAAARPLSSAEFQAIRRWQQAVESCGSLGFDGRRMNWTDFLSQLGRALDETLFAPESRSAPIQIAGPAESAGLTADAVWFLSADENAWPGGGATHPLLPIEVQREFGMPHATPQLDWELARSVTRRLLASAPEVHFSYARQNEAVEARPSLLIAQFAGEAQKLTEDFEEPKAEAPLTVPFEDYSRIPFPPGKVSGGATVLTAQSQCPFKAFATARLAAQSWKPAEASLTAAERGSLLHAALHSIWGGAPGDRSSSQELKAVPPEGIRSHRELLNLTDRKAFVAGHVQRVFAEELRPHQRERMPRRYLELEEQRLTGLIAEWLDYEAARVEFAVAETEVKRTVHIAGLTFDLRLDRIDRLNDGSLLVIDYKSGNVNPQSWDVPRPDDVQLPLYAGFALDSEEVLGGLAFAKVRTSKMEFAGSVGDAAATLFTGLKGGSPLVRNPFTAEQLLDWRDCIEQLASDFLRGRAEVDPRDPPRTCQRCGLQTLCRIQEHQAQPDAEDDAEDDAESEEAGDE